MKYTVDHVRFSALIVGLEVQWLEWYDFWSLPYGRGCVEIQTPCIEINPGKCPPVPYPHSDGVLVSCAYEYFRRHEKKYVAPRVHRRSVKLRTF